MQMTPRSVEYWWSYVACDFEDVEQSHLTPSLTLDKFLGRISHNQSEGGQLIGGYSTFHVYFVLQPS
jgi:hypothetical protein